MLNTDTTSARLRARRCGRLLGAGAAIIALVQVLAAASGAAANAGTIVSVQRGLVDLASGGGADFGLPLLQLIPMFLVTSLAGLLTFLIMLTLCWYAGRVAASETGQRGVGAYAGYWVALVGSLVWLAVTLLVVGITHLDGTFAWFVGSLVVVLTSSGDTITGAYMTAPGPLYVFVELLLLVIQGLVGLVFALTFGAFAGRLGASHPSGSAPTPRESLFSPSPLSSR